MADLTANAPLRFDMRVEPKTIRWAFDSSGAQTVYKGQPVILDISVDTIYATAYIDSVVVAADDIFLGIAAEPLSVAASAVETDDTNKIELYCYPTIIGFKSAVFTNADVGDTVYMSDSATLSATAADNPMIGKLDHVEDGYAFVQISSPTICTGA